MCRQPGLLVPGQALVLDCLTLPLLHVGFVTPGKFPALSVPWHIPYGVIIRIQLLNTCTLFRLFSDTQ